MREVDELPDRSGTLRAQQQRLFGLARRELPALQTDASASFSSAEVAWIKAGSSSEARSRLAIYRYAYFSRLVECFTEDYAVLKGFLGYEFESLCLEYIQRFPPQGPDLNLYSAGFSDFLRARKEAWASFAADLAALEWALVAAVHVKGYAALDEAALAQVFSGAAPLVVNPSLLLLQSNYPVGEFYQSAMDKDVSEDVDAAEAVPETARDLLLAPALQPSVTAVCRRDGTVWRVNILPAMLPVLEQLQSGVPLEEALTLALSGKKAEALDADVVQRAFANWVSAGFFVDAAGVA
jgi:hypothetical protein